MMRLSVILIWLSHVVSSDCIGQTNSRFFEGVVTYVVSYGKATHGVDSLFGDTVKVFIKQGNYKRVYNTTHNGGIKEELVDPEKGIMYMKLVGSDTVYWFDLKVTGDFEEISSKAMNSTLTVLEEKCSVLSVTVKVKGFDPELVVEHKFFYSGLLKLEPSWFEFYNYSFSNRWFAITGAHFLKYEWMSPVSTMSMTAVDVKRVKLGMAQFAVDKTHLLVEFKMP